jgi:sugar/nucleoside kinase (ribokinase family)
MNPVDITVIGNIINETIKFPDSTIGPVLGSPAAYSSIAMSAVGARPGLVSYYGPDMEKQLEEHLFKVDRRGMIKVEQSTTNYLIYNEDGTKRVEYLHKAPLIKASDIPGEYRKCGYFYICPMDYEVDIEVNKMLYEADKTVVVDMGGYGGATSYKRLTIFEPEGEKIISEVARYSSIIKASREDLSYIAPGMEVGEVCEYFFSKGAKQCVVTLGAEGGYYQRAGEKGVHVKNFVADNPIDFTGAGDSFGAGLMVSLSQGRDIRDAVVFGNAVASLVIEKTGGCVWERMPSLEKVRNRIKSL